MAGDEQATAEFTQILSSLQRKFDIIHTKWTENKLFEIKFRTQIQRNGDDFNVQCDEWVDLFSESTNTVWVKKISNTGPKILFRKQYQCWTQEGKVVQKELLFDARRCKGTLDMKVLTDNSQTRRKNKHIKLGLNVVVKINFTHLHPVNTSEPFAFFVHTCEPQPEAPKPIIQPNNNLPKLVADMVLKGLSASPKVVNPNANLPQRLPFHQTNNKCVENNQSLLQNNAILTLNLSETKPNLNEHKEATDHQNELNNEVSSHQQSLEQCSSEILQNLQVQNMDSLHLGHVVPLQNMDSIKVELPPQLQQLTQVVVSAPQIDMNEPLLMCQPTIMFDTSQVINHTIPHHFVQVQNIHNHQHYL